MKKHTVGLANPAQNITAEAVALQGPAIDAQPSRTIACGRRSIYNDVTIM